jgi:hypothetical protein
MNWQTIGDWFKSALTFVTRTVKALAPAAEVVGTATGNPEVTAAAKLAEVSADAVDEALNYGERDK